MAYLPTEEEWALAHVCLVEHYERRAAREFEDIEVHRRVHDSLLAKKKEAEKSAAERERQARAALVRTYDQALRNGKAGLDYLPDQKCEVCGGMPYFNGARFVEHHDQTICKSTGPIIVSGHRSESTGLARIDPSSLLGRARRTTGERDDD